jgi:hypothetical protein
MVFGFYIGAVSTAASIVGAVGGLDQLRRMMPKKPEKVVEETETSITIESPHRYPDDANYSRVITLPGATAIKVTFDERCSTESCDVLLFTPGDSIPGFQQQQISATIKKSGGGNWAPVIIEGDTVSYRFTSDGSVSDWGYKFTAEACDDTEGWEFVDGIGCPPEIVQDSDTQYTVESQHPYSDNEHKTKEVTIPGASALEIKFSPDCVIEHGCDYLCFGPPDQPAPEYYDCGIKRSGTELRTIYVKGDTAKWLFHSDGSCNEWGYQFTVKQIDAVPEDAEQYNDCGSELLFEGQFSEGAAATPSR